MDPGPGAPTAGSFIPLSETEQRCYSGLHALCQADSSGKLAASKVLELFRASQLPADTLHQITAVCGAKRLGYFGTGQFYVALKLLAAAQVGLPVRLESTTADLPLPMFVGMKGETDARHLNHSQAADALPRPTGAVSGTLPRAREDRATLRHTENSSEMQQEPWSPPRSPGSSPPSSPSAHRSYPYGAQRNGTDTLLAYENKILNYPSVPQENSPSHYGNKPPLDQPSIARAPSVERLVERLVERDAVEHSEDPWRITEEQRDYYTNQFRSLQPDLGGLILGTAAKNFFTKSKLPIQELSHIWELSDVDRDGALTFPEFCVAFHLIVARKNGYALPDRLPLTLQPGPPPQGRPTGPGTQTTPPLIVFEDTGPRPQQQEMGGVDMQMTQRPRLPSSKQDVTEEVPSADLSPKRGPRPAEDPAQVGSSAPGRPDPPHELDPNMRSKTRPRSYSSTSIDDAMKKGEEPPTPPPRPQTHSRHSRASSLDLNKLLQQSSQGIQTGWLPHPPALPPRPPATQLPPFLPAAEKTTQKAVQQPTFADFSRFREEEEAGQQSGALGPIRGSGPNTEDLRAPNTESGPPPLSLVPQKPVRRKLHPESQNLEATPPSATPYSASTVNKPTQRLKREIQTAIRKNKETNAILTRLNSELQQQLKEVHQERITLEAQLEILRPATS